MATRGEPIYLDGNDDQPWKPVTRKNTSTGLVEAATGLSGLTFRLSATKNGAAIHGTLSKSATEVGTTGEYQATFEGSDLTAQLAALVDTDIWEVFGDGLNVNFNTVRRVLAVRTG